jgi:hypothetical protein
MKAIPCRLAVVACLLAATLGSTALGSPSAPLAAPASTPRPPSQTSLFGAAGAGPFSVRPTVFSEPPLRSDFSNVSVGTQAAPSRSSAYSAGIRRDRSYREVKGAIDDENLTAACYAYAHDIGRECQARAIGAPLPPDEGENAGGRLQARFPLLSLAW